MLPPARAGLGVASLRHSVHPSETIRYGEHPLADFNQTWYTVSIWQGVKAYLISRSSVKGQGQIGLRIFWQLDTLH